MTQLDFFERNDKPILDVLIPIKGEQYGAKSTESTINDSPILGTIRIDCLLRPKQ